jgi:hypothetical protein
MSKLTTFIYVFRQSAFKPDYYRDVLKAPFSFSFKYFLTLFLSISLITISIISIFVIQELNPFINKAKTEIFKLYPSDLSITIKKGEVSTTVNEPYFVPIKKEWLPQEVRDSVYFPPVHNLLVIDTKATSEDVKQYQTFALLNKTGLTVYQNANDTRTYSLADIKDWTLNKTIVDNFLNLAIPYFNWIIPIVIILLFTMILFFTLLFKYLYLLIISLIIWSTTKIAGFNLGFKKTLQINLHAITLPLVINMFFQLFGVEPQIPFFQTIILIIFNLIIFTSIKDKLTKGKQLKKLDSKNIETVHYQ